jgi:CheY-like chemotaxis protein
MAKSGPIILIEDDIDDLKIVTELLKELNVRNPIIHISEGEEAIPFLMTTKTRPFMILCDVDLPNRSGLEIRDSIIENDFLRKKSIPFIFFTTINKQEVVEKAYRQSVQGYFHKPDTLDELRDSLNTIVRYWTLCRHPNND